LIMSEKPLENCLHRALMDTYINWMSAQPAVTWDIQAVLAEVAVFIREMISQIDPKDETARLEAIVFALTEVADAMHDLIERNPPRH
jgi:hypothetical protein